MELNREQIIKALECLSGNRDIECDKCYFYWHGGRGKSCRYGVSEAALSLINELTEEISNEDKKAFSLIKELTEENERLRANAKSATEILNFKFAYDAGKADTVRKMQAEIEARCIKGGIYPAFVKSTIDQIAKEMLEETI